MKRLKLFTKIKLYLACPWIV